ncbi:hypothetical protein L3X38_002683 [Prunus dulcis]|uniref:Major facilitator superfamily (MFS) profile domain-containing protein n=1 Tax=Prunus dulcis TaxID=3755 RepID=A0AAD4ZL00_PRUDU|nr:hypothetical protein L3X38_002683 [Prunus dulcis]
MLIIGRILLGCGVGFANQAVPLFLSEIAPTRIRGALNILFQLNITIGILFANLINYGTAKIEGGYGWRVSLGLAGIPAEFLEIVEASRVAQEVKHPFRNLLKRRNRPQLVIAIWMQIFQQFTGINAVMFYAPFCFILRVVLGTSRVVDP